MLLTLPDRLSFHYLFTHSFLQGAKFAPRKLCVCKQSAMRCFGQMVLNGSVQSLHVFCDPSSSPISQALFPSCATFLSSTPPARPPPRGASCALYGHLVERDKGNAAALCRLQLGETPASDSVAPNLVRTTIVPVVTMRSPSDL